MVREKRNPASSLVPTMGTGKALIVGHLVVNLPMMILMVAFFFGGRALFGLGNSLLYLAVGFLLGWVWWTFATPRWRGWALRGGVDEFKLHKWAIWTGLTWPTTSRPEKKPAKSKRSR
jgi:hypothetical protein